MRRRVETATSSGNSLWKNLKAMFALFSGVAVVVLSLWSFAVSRTAWGEAIAIQHENDAAVQMLRQVTKPMIPQEAEHVMMNHPSLLSTTTTRREAQQPAPRGGEDASLSPELQTIQAQLEAEWQELVQNSNHLDDDSNFLELPNVLSTDAVATDKESSSLDVTLTTFCTMTQLDLLPNLKRQWTGPLSVAVYMDQSLDIASFLHFGQAHAPLLSNNTSIHVLLENVATETEAIPPENRLRNLALQYAQSEYCLILDIEFVPSPRMYANLMQVLHTNYRVKAVLNEYRLLAIPAFEFANVTLVGLQEETPVDKQALVERIQDGSVVLSPMPNVSVVASAMDFGKWQRLIPGAIYIIDWKRGYQPFVLARRRGLPAFWPGFRDATYSRQGWFEELYERYYTMGILRSYFCFRVRRGRVIVPTASPNGAEDEYKQFRQYIHRTYVQDPTLTTKLFALDSTKNADCDLSTITSASTTHDSSLEFSETEKIFLCDWKEFLSNSSAYRRQYPRVLLSSRNNNEQSQDTGAVALALHGSVNRLDRLVTGIQRWKGPASVAVYISSHQSIAGFFQFHRRHAPILASVTFHFFFEKILEEKDKLYPHNYLRNLASDYSDADYVIVCDMDFVTNQDAYTQLRRLLETNSQVKAALDNQTVFVLPAFENGKTESGQDVELPPETKTDLVEQVLKKKTVEPFHVRKYAAGHGPTNFTRWLATDAPLTYDIEFNVGFEPYVVGRREGLPKFWTAFRGFGFNKQSWCEEVNRMGYKFAVLRDFFVFHVGKSSGMVDTPAWVHQEYERIFRPRLDRLYLKIGKR